MKNLSLKLRMMIYSTIMVIMVVTSISSILLYSYYTHVWEEFDLRTDSVKKSLADDLELMVFLENKEKIKEMLEKQIGADILSISVFNKKGKFLVRSGEKLSAISAEYQKVVSSDIVIVPIEITEEMLEPATGMGPETIGRVEITFSTLKLKTNLMETVYFIIFLTIMIVILRIGIDYLFTSGITTPLNRLVEGAEAVTGGDLNHKIEVEGGGEVGKLAASFSRMMTALREREGEIKINHQKLETSYTDLEESHHKLDKAYVVLEDTAKELGEYKEDLEEKVRDRTRDLEEVNVKLVAAYKKIKEVDRLKSEFLANMSHELRTPLNSIIGFSKIILKGIDGPITDLQNSDLTAIHSSGRHLLNLINDILDLSKIESGKMELFHEDVDMLELVRSVISTCIALAKEKGLEIVINEEGEGCVIRADRTRINQVVINIISNAIKFTQKGKVGVSIKKIKKKDLRTIEENPDSYCPQKSSMKDEEDLVLVSIEDTGEGISVEDMPKIFDMFRQVDASSTRREGGTGLGMAITHQIVEMHGGEIWVESFYRKGSIFHFAIPVKETMVEVQWEDPLSIVSTGDSKNTVAVIDDDPTAITLYRKILEKEGYQVIEMRDPEMALPEVITQKPDFIILDVLMPKKDGWEMMQELKSNSSTKHIPVIFCSIVSDKKLGFSLGATDYLVKPVSDDDLLYALEKLNSEGAINEILVIDDSRQDAELIARTLRSHGYSYKIVGGGKEGIAAVKENCPSLIILDLMMPEVDGFCVIEQVKQNPKTRDTPIIVLSAKDLTSEDKKKLSGHVEMLIKKGFYTEDELMNDVIASLKKMR